MNGAEEVYRYCRGLSTNPNAINPGIRLVQWRLLIDTETEVAVRHQLQNVKMLKI